MVAQLGMSYSVDIANGRSGGILFGVNTDVIDIGSVDEGEYYVKFILRNKSDGFKWVLVVVYGAAAQPEFKEKFLTELFQACAKESLPLMVGGDFNIIRNPKEKNNDWYNDRWPFLFNVVIDSLDFK